ncbi:MAG: hypothetical protein OEY85_03095, partial [Rhodospirillales bacterium]|nr:hypothetical protein [Rhodospirillales bacterium]
MGRIQGAKGTGNGAMVVPLAWMTFIMESGLIGMAECISIARSITITMASTVTVSARRGSARTATVAAT